MIAFTKHVKSLLTNETLNIAESFFALVCKTDNGKRTLVSQRGAYGAHIVVAVVAHNTGEVLSTYIRNMGLEVPEVVSKMESALTRKYLFNATQKQVKRKRGIDSNVSSQTSNKALKMSCGAEDYGIHSQQRDITSHDYEELLSRHIEVLENVTEDFERTERETRGQLKNIKWLYLSRKYLLARDFGRVFKLKKAISRVKVVSEIIKAAKIKSVMANYRIESKKQASKDYEQLNKVQVRNRGIIVTKKYPDLAASPEGIMVDVTIGIIECPYTARNTTPAEHVYVSGTDGCENKL
ncbi:hypothetical protein PV326_012385 [Microctonus aethiopoides]|nr:hypothetical protein PV326_012385 [Microctonus aethiopoides]